MIIIKHKSISITLALVLLAASLFAGCGKKDAADVKDTAAKEAAVTEENQTEPASDTIQVVANDDDASAEMKDDETTNETAAADYKETIKQFANDYYESHKDQEGEYSKFGFGLIYFDDDDIPELVAGVQGYFVNLYKFDKGEVITIIDNWAYGAGGNAGYDYCEKAGIVYNSNSDMAGGEEYETYYKWNPESRELESLNDKVLMMRHFTDVNGDGNYDWSDLEQCEYMETPTYWVDDIEVTEEEYKKYCYEGDFKPIYGELTIDELNASLDN